MSESDIIKAVTVRLTGLPPDPEGMNDMRSASATVAMSQYLKEGAPLSDLLCDLMHWADRHSEDSEYDLSFEGSLARARRAYIEETTSNV